MDPNAAEIEQDALALQYYGHTFTELLETFKRLLHTSTRQAANDLSDEVITEDINRSDKFKLVLQEDMDKMYESLLASYDEPLKRLEADFRKEFAISQEIVSPEEIDLFASMDQKEMQKIQEDKIRLQTEYKQTKAFCEIMKQKLAKSDEFLEMKENLDKIANKIVKTREVLTETNKKLSEMDEKVIRQMDLQNCSVKELYVKISNSRD